ncbi:hypothetical protein Tco_0954000 [Tanacetum coccineum]|uniref:Uncharacterized protein n=1 Tax=Tanacetum coccineum TaxID=301880 RepID=A0ABQ5E1J5_9ASTR
MNEEPQAASIAETHHQSPPPQADKPQSSHYPSTEASDTDSSCDDILKKYDNILPLTELQLVKYLRKATVNYADLKASIDDYYDENIAHRDQTDKLVEASMSSLDKSSNTISDLNKGLNIITELLKEIKKAVKDDSVNRKISEATNSIILALDFLSSFLDEWEFRGLPTWNVMWGLGGGVTLFCHGVGEGRDRDDE